MKTKLQAVVEVEVAVGGWLWMWWTKKLDWGSLVVEVEVVVPETVLAVGCGGDGDAEWFQRWQIEAEPSRCCGETTGTCCERLRRSVLL